MNTWIVGLVELCARYRGTVVIGGLLLLCGATTYVAERFSINTDVEGLISQELPWHERQAELTKAFPQRAISVVISAPTAENAETATNELARALQSNPSLFHAVAQPDSGSFFERNGLLFGSTADVQRTSDGLTQAEPFLAALAADPSLRGVMKVLAAAADSVPSGGGSRSSNWHGRFRAPSRRSATFSRTSQLRFPGKSCCKVTPCRPVNCDTLSRWRRSLDFAALQPGRAAEQGIRAAAADSEFEVQARRHRGSHGRGRVE